DTTRARVRRAAVVAAAASVLVALVTVIAAEGVRVWFSLDPDESRWAVEAAAVGLPFLALTNVWLGATRGLKIMRYTLYIFWAGQPLLWIAFILAGWQLSERPWVAVLAYSLSWAVAAAAAFAAWHRESSGWPGGRLVRGEGGRLLRYAGPRAPAALFSQLLFWTDLFVLTRFATDQAVGVYSGALRAGQVVVLFLTSVNLMFSPFVADLYNRGEIAALDRLFKSLTRWTLGVTLPLFVVLAVAPRPVLELFGPSFSEGHSALLILLAGQLVNVATGGAGFVLLMIGRTGWDLAVYAASFALNVALALWLCPRYGIEGAAVANGVTFACSNAVRLVLVKRFAGIQPYDRAYGRLLLPAGAAAVAGWAAHRLVDGSGADLVVTAAAVVAAYAAGLVAAGLTRDERAAAKRLAGRIQAR
ncbi:MAG: polysaccharide biosynthesis C-terminal domain-containing protein, partial [Actinomycetota bacterium]